MIEEKITKENVGVVNINQLLTRLVNLSAQKSQGYSSGQQLFIDTVNNQVIPEMEMITAEIKSRVK